MESVSATTLPQGYGYEWTGTALQEKEAAGKTSIILALALLFAHYVASLVGAAVVVRFALRSAAWP